jgi:hypothetical protein
VPHLRDTLTVAKVGIRARRDPLRTTTLPRFLSSRLNPLRGSKVTFRFGLTARVALRRIWIEADSTSLPMARKARRALFTDSESGKCSTISGSRIAICTLLEQVGALAANCCGPGGSAGGLRILHRVLLGWISGPCADDIENTLCFINCWLWREGLPQGLKPLPSIRRVAKAKALAYLEAKAVRLMLFAFPVPKTHDRVPDLHDSLILDKVGIRAARTVLLPGFENIALSSNSSPATSQSSRRHCQRSLKTTFGRVKSQ